MSKAKWEVSSINREASPEEIKEFNRIFEKYYKDLPDGVKDNFKAFTISFMMLGLADMEDKDAQHLYEIGIKHIDRLKDCLDYMMKIRKEL